MNPKSILALAALTAIPNGGYRTASAAPATVSASRASVSGVVKLLGDPPKPTPINMAKEPTCAKMHVPPATTEDVVTGPGGTLSHVIVYISEGAPDQDAAPQEPVTITQKGCTYIPHVIAMQANQKLQVVNADSTSHNIHPLPVNNREWNRSQPPGQPPFEESFARDEVAIPVKCNVHPWMRAYIAVFHHPWFAVTGPAGSFELKNLPAGNYTVQAWHEKYGTLTEKVTIGANDAKRLEFTFKPRPGR
jgi:hypothetical protein